MKYATASTRNEVYLIRASYIITGLGVSRSLIACELSWLLLSNLIFVVILFLSPCVRTKLNSLTETVLDIVKVFYLINWFEIVFGDHSCCSLVGRVGRRYDSLHSCLQVNTPKTHYLTENEIRRIFIRGKVSAVLNNATHIVTIR